MLKWAVNGARQSYLPASTNLTTGCEHAEQTDLALPLARNQRLKRKSSELFPQRRKLRWEDKENLMRTTSTPLQANNRCAPLTDNMSPLRNLDSLKDISNISLETIAATPPPKTPEQKPRMPRQYSSTLPTFDVEYSPNGMIPGPILALRGMGVPDSYFEKPRYLTQHDLEAHLEKRAAANNIKATQMNRDRPARRMLLKNKTNVAKSKIQEPLDEQPSLSSSKMGDLTLDRMIDAILESTRKERKIPRCAHLRHVPPPTMSPTYTPAEDPASDLHEYWDPASAQYLPNLSTPATTAKTTTTAKTKLDFNEREVRDSPSLVDRLRHTHSSYQLMRQRAVRRKRKLSKMNKSLLSAAHKQALLETLNSSRDALPPTPLAASTTPTARSKISPDSGHNSTSDLEDSPEADLTLKPIDDAVEVPKRKLSFSHDQTITTTTMTT